MLKLPSIIRSKPKNNQLPYFYRVSAGKHYQLKDQLQIYQKSKSKSFSKSRYLRFLKDRPQGDKDIFKKVEISFKNHEPRNCGRSAKLQKVMIRRQMDFVIPRLRIKTQHQQKSTPRAVFLSEF